MSGRQVRSQYSHPQDSRHRAQRPCYRHLEKVADQHLGADESQQWRQADLQVSETMQKAGQQEEEGPQPLLS